MPNDSNNNVSNSVTASPTAPPIRRYNERDEAEFLRQQRQDAKKAIQQTRAAMRETTTTATDAWAWTRAYPWPSVGAAALGGLMASTLLPSLLGRTAPARADAAASSRSSLVSFVQSSLWGVIRSVVISTIASAVYVEAQPPAPDHDESAGE
jgi:hypothetical protein